MELTTLEVSVGVLQPAFDPAVTDYTLDVGIDDGDVEIIADYRNTTASLSIGGHLVGRGVGERIVVPPGETLIEIIERSVTGRTASYVVRVRRPSTCGDGHRNGAETDVDCGGPCAPCLDNQACAAPSDCASKVCDDHVCKMASCSDGVANADELDVDCGGHCGLASCDAGQMCSATEQCAPNLFCADVCVVPKRVFVTNQTFTGAQIGGLSGGDAKCQGAANAAGLNGTYRAWLSDATGSPSTRFVQSTTPYVRTDGVLIANDWKALTDGNLNAPISKTETQSVTASEPICNGATHFVFTNTTPAGTMNNPAQSCSGWTSDLGGSGWGNFSDASPLWTLTCTGGNFCDKHAPLYCFEQ